MYRGLNNSSNLKPQTLQTLQTLICVFAIFFLSLPVINVIC
jgi:hypothetical protein